MYTQLNNDKKPWGGRDMDKMRALVAYGPNDLRLEKIDIPGFQADEVLIQVKACGICGSDMPRALQGAAIIKSN
jgi:L-iditol 2-dehydrogenase